MKRFLIFVCLVLCFWLLGCSPSSVNNNNTSNKFIVTFDTEGGSAIAQQIVEKGCAIVRPNDPVKDGYFFDGWYVGDEKWSFINNTVNSDLTLEAHWTEDKLVDEECTLTIKFNDGKTEDLVITQKYNTVLEKIDNPSRYHYFFKGWSSPIPDTMPKGSNVIEAEWIYDKTIYISIFQYVTHSSLDSSKKGFIDGLKEEGYKDGDNIKITFYNPEAETVNMDAMASMMVLNSDIVFAIATPAAIAVKEAATKQSMNETSILFTAVTDPVNVQLVDSFEKPGLNITGTIDDVPVACQIDLLKELLPNVKKIGILYNLFETSSKRQADIAKEKATELGIQVLERTAYNSADLMDSLQQLINDGVEVLYLPADNLVASNMVSIAQVCNNSKIPTVCGASGMVSAGGTITCTINYYYLGKQTAKMAIKIIKGAKANELPVENQDISLLDLVVNEDALKKTGITLPDSIKDRLNKPE